MLHAAPSAPDLLAAGAGKERRRASVRINVSPRRIHDLGGSVRASQAGPAIGLIAQVLLLAVLAGTAGLGAAGAVVGGACAVTMAAALARGLARARGDRLGPASWVTLARATLAVAVAALVADSFAHDTPVALLVTLAAVALALDAVDGWLARRTGTATALGARFDGEVDAFLILALSVYVAPAYGAWVIAIGAARYLFLAGEWLLPWMRAPLPPRRWRRMVAAAQGIVLTVAAAEVLPRPLTQALLVAALAALAASVGECAWWLWRRRHAVRDQVPAGDVAAPERGPLRTGIAVALTVLALLLVWAALVAPNQPSQLDVGAFARLPLELLVVVALAVLLPAVPRRVLAVVAGTVLAVLVVVKVLDMGFITAFDRPFDPVSDSSYVGIGVETLRDAIGRSSANLAVAAIVVLLVGLLALSVLALLRLTRVAAGHRDWALRAAAVLGVLWVALRVLGAPVASTSAATLAVDEVQAVRSGLRAHEILAREIPRDRFRATPGDRLLAGLRGKDVLLLFVESYGRVAVQGSSFSPGVDAVLDKGTAQLRAGGFSSRSAFLTSSTFGGLSWLAHSTLQSGIRIGTQRGYNQLVKSDRLTLSGAFRRAGWRTVSEDPANKRTWPEGSSFYHYDKIYDRRNVGYRGPGFGLPPMPDQYVLEALQRLELAKRPRPPLFAEVDLISSHAPWTRIPRLIPWDDVGDGSIFDRVPAEESTRATLFGDSDRARAAYGHSIEYTMSTIVSFVQRYGDDKLVVVLLGDHQPATIVSGQGASHDVPISVIAHDPKVMEQIAGWGWRDGLLPSPQAPVWPMSAFRDRFLAAFGSSPASG
jgi:phosphatidylglycerophosphate synthase